MDWVTVSVCTKLKLVVSRVEVVLELWVDWHLETQAERQLKVVAYSLVVLEVERQVAESHLSLEWIEVSVVSVSDTESTWLCIVHEIFPCVVCVVTSGTLCVTISCLS